MNTKSGFMPIVMFAFAFAALMVGGGVMYVATHIETDPMPEEYDQPSEHDLGLIQRVPAPGYQNISEMIVSENDTDSTLVDNRTREAHVPIPPIAEKVPDPVISTPTLEIVDKTPPPVIPEPKTKPLPPTTACASNPAPIFSHDITDISRISQITPPGTIFDNGIVKSHSYLWIEDGKQVPLYAPIDMKLAAGSYYTQGSVSHFLLFFQVSCEVEIKFDHVLDPVQAIRAVLPTEPVLNDSRTKAPSEFVSFKAGDIIGYTPGNTQSHNWDFGVYNTTVYPNAITNGVEHLEDIDKRADCAYDYFDSSKAERYRDLFLVEIGGSSRSIPYCDL